MNLVHLVCGHPLDKPGAYWVLRAYKEESKALEDADTLNTRAFDRDSGFRFKVVSIKTEESEE